MEILVIIPARGGSKGIPKKNIRLMAGKPLISYTIKATLESKYSPDVVVTTDSQEIVAVAKSCGAEIVLRDEDLSSDMVTLDPVIYHAKNVIENRNNKKYDWVITVQPTSPLLTTDTLDRAIKYAIENDFDTVISVVNKPHLSWGKNEQGYVYPLYKERKNRQELPPQYFETGAFVITKADAVKENTRLGKKISVFEVPEEESIDIDDKNDWAIAESILRRKKIIFRADGYKQIGMGHIYNCITMAFSLVEHDVLIVTNDKAKEGIAKLQETNLPYRVFKSNQELKTIIAEFQPDIWVNDCLNTEKDYVEQLKKVVPRVVTIEDLGAGAQVADAVINALYPDITAKHIFSGWKYVCLRDEFLLHQPKPFSDAVENVLIMFGGTDPSNLNKTLYDIILRIAEQYPQTKFNFITGIGYDAEKNNVITQEEKNVYVYPNVPRVTEYMKQADLAITSQGRTIFELAAMGIPSIVLSQNEREGTHNFAQLENGFLNLGLGIAVNPNVIENTLDWLIKTKAIRKNMHDLMLKYPLRTGTERVKKIILGEYDGQ